MSNLKPSSVDDLMSVNNVGSYRIRSITIGERWGSSGVTFTADSGVPIEITVTGENDEVVRTFDYIEKAVGPSLRGPWPAVLDFFIDGSQRVFSFFITMVCIMLASPLRSGLLNGLPGVPGPATHLLAITLPPLLILIGLVIPFLGHFIYTKVYPKGIFLIGAGEDQYGEVRARKQFFSPLFIVATIILGIACALIVHWIGL